MARVLNEVDIRRIAAAWGPDEIRAAQRQRNLDAFLDLAVEYEKHAIPTADSLSLPNGETTPSRAEVMEVALDDGRVVRGFVDVLAETEKGWLVIDHKSSPQPPSRWPEEATKYSGQLAAYKNALSAADRNAAACYIHFAVTGGLVEVRTPHAVFNPSAGSNRP